MSDVKRKEQARFKEKLIEKYDSLSELPYPSVEFDARYEEIQRDYEKLKELSEEATLEWLEEISKREKTDD